MATNTNLGGVFTTDIQQERTNNVFISTENVVGLIFDTSVVGGVEKAFEKSETAKGIFGEGNVVELNTAKDMVEAGIDENVLFGIAKYHLDCFFNLAGGNQRIFVSFMDSSKDTEFEAVENMQLASGGIIYQIGVWTGNAIAEDGDDTYTVKGNGVLGKLQTVAELLGGKVGKTNFDGNAPLNILLTAPIIEKADVDFSKLPDLSAQELPKVSMLLGQAASEEVHKIMFAVNHVSPDTPTFAVVGCLGAALGCLAVAPANESIAHVANFNIAKVAQEAELGVGKLVDNDDKDAYKPESSFTNIKTLRYSKRNENLHKKGYIFLTNYDGLENSIFFSSDQTLSTGDYRTIARCRVMHKSRRVVRRALLPKVNDDVEVDISTGKLSASAISEFQNIVIQALDMNMVEPGTSRPQYSGRTCTIDENQDVLNTDEIKINYAIVPHGVTSVISVTEGFVSSI